MTAALTPEDTETLRRLARQGIAPDLIADRLGRSRGALSDRAAMIGAWLRKERVVRAAGLAETPPFGARAGTSTPQAGRVIENLNVPERYVRVRRGARSPMPWTWEIRQGGHTNSLRSAVRGYRPAEEAWEAGRAALARLRSPGPR